MSLTWKGDRGKPNNLLFNLGSCQNVASFKKPVFDILKPLAAVGFRWYRERLNFKHLLSQGHPQMHYRAIQIFYSTVTDSDFICNNISYDLHPFLSLHFVSCIVHIRVVVLRTQGSLCVSGKCEASCLIYSLPATRLGRLQHS